MEEEQGAYPDAAGVRLWNRASDRKVTGRRESGEFVWGENGPDFERYVRLPVDLLIADPVLLQLLEQGRLGDPELARRLRLVPHLAGEFTEDVCPLRLLPAREPGRAFRLSPWLRRLAQEGEIRSGQLPAFRHHHGPLDR